ncbi:MAG: phosphoribosyl-ATP diphosphatase [Massilimaliae sp.]|jgi:phosphoribosyl-ATP pyrophosphohydrolase|nr:phosphoribosyl-ATP diphosphatase [Massiliimalia sp.]
MQNETLQGLYEIVKERKENFEEGSYTCYLFQKGLDKILKKCGEECTEMVIAAKNQDQEELSNEMGDLIYHMMVLMVEAGLSLDDVGAVLEERRQKTGNLKKFHVVDKNS